MILIDERISGNTLTDKARKNEFTEVRYCFQTLNFDGLKISY